MALNLSSERSTRHTLPVPSGVVSGDPVVFGHIPGVALTSRDAAGNATVELPFAAVTVQVAVGGIDGSGNSAVVVGNSLYFTAGDTPKINKKTTGTRYGVALGAVDSAGSATIKVLLG
jgi:predicted RecA/RadA family phage recombinase